MKISVIIPVYNVENYLKKCLDSIIGQTYSDLEIIIINDGSTDSSPDVINEYAEKDKRIITIVKENGGLVSAWKAGLEKASGKYVTFVDSDDFISDNYVNALVSALKPNVDLVCTQCTRYVSDTVYAKRTINELKQGEYPLDDKFFSYFIIGGKRDKPISNARWAKLIKTDIAKKCAAYCSEKVHFGEDQQFTTGVLLNCKTAVCIDDYGYFYRYNPCSIVQSYKQNLWEKCKLLIRTIKNIPETRSVPNIDEQLKLQLLEYLYECLKNEELCGNGLKKDYFLKITGEAESFNLFDVNGKKLPGSLSKALFNPVRRKNFTGVKFILGFYKAVKKNDARYK